MDAQRARKGRRRGYQVPTYLLMSVKTNREGATEVKQTPPVGTYCKKKLRVPLA